MRTLFKVGDRNLLAGLGDGGSSFLAPVAILDGLTGEHAVAKPHGLPHSIAEIVAHMCYWQEWFNRCATTGCTPPPEHAAEGWPEVSVEGWDALRSRFLASIEESKKIAVKSNTLDEPLLPEGSSNPFLDHESHGSGILHAMFHTGHHLGQVVTIRQLMGLWPPAAGSMTW